MVKFYTNILFYIFGVHKHLHPRSLMFLDLDVQGGNLQPASHPQERDLDAWSFLNRRIPSRFPSHPNSCMDWLIFSDVRSSSHHSPAVRIALCLARRTWQRRPNERGMVCMCDVSGTHTVPGAALADAAIHMRVGDE